MFGPIDFFGLSVLFSQYRSCDDPQGVWTFVVFIRKTACEHENVQLWKKMLSWVSSHDLSWENKIDKRKKVYLSNVWPKGRFERTHVLWIMKNVKTLGFFSLTTRFRWFVLLTTRTELERNWQLILSLMKTCRYTGTVILSPLSILPELSYCSYVWFCQTTGIAWVFPLLPVNPVTNKIHACLNSAEEMQKEISFISGF